MNRALLSLSFIAFLAACDGNPLDPVPGFEGSGIGEGGADNTEADNCDGSNEVCTGEVNLFTYDNRGTADPSDDRLEINNLPFDFANRYVYNAALSAAYTDTMVFLNANGDATYVALFADGNRVQAGVVLTDEYNIPSYGGSVMRSDGATLPAVGEAIFEGEYAGLRISSTGGPAMTRVRGMARLRLDFEDFDLTDAVDGLITGRVAIDQGFADLPTVGITTTGFDGSQIERTAATELLGPNESGASGFMDGIIGGNVANGNAEIAGIIDMTGTDFLNDEFNVRELGAFVIPQISYESP